MTKQEFERTMYNNKISYEQYMMCYCPKCKEKECIHRECFRRMPKAVGGLGLCPNLAK